MELKKMLKLSKEQESKLEKLDLELKEKRQHDERVKDSNMNSSRSTGIPINIVGMDVFKIGLMLGIIKSKEDFAAYKKSEGLLSLFQFDRDDETESRRRLYDDVPKHYSTVEFKVTEREKIDYHANLVRKVCDEFQTDIVKKIQRETAIVSNHLAISIKTCTIDCFVDACATNVGVLIDILKDDLLSRDETASDDIASTCVQINALLRSMIGFVDIRRYRNFLVQLRNVVDYESVISKTALNDGLLFKHFATFNSDDARDLERLETYLTIKRFMRDPKLTPFCVKTVIDACCSPTLMFLDVRRVIEKELIGPFNNNPIGYLDVSASSFFIMTDITSANVRLWVLDHGLSEVTRLLIASVRLYAVDLFRAILVRLYGTSMYVSDCWTAHRTIGTLLRNISILNDAMAMNDYLKNLLIRQSVIIPTELDVFNDTTTLPTVMIRPSPRDDAITMVKSEQLFDSKVCAQFRTVWPSIG